MVIPLEQCRGHARCFEETKVTGHISLQNIDLMPNESLLPDYERPLVLSHPGTSNTLDSHTEMVLPLFFSGFHTKAPHLPFHLTQIEMAGYFSIRFNHL